MIRRAAILLAIPVALVGGFYGSMHYVEAMRVRDATPAFEPLVPLGVEVWSTPIAFHRYCNYVVEFPPRCQLRDGNVSELLVLNRLPADNYLNVVIARPISDESLPVLARLEEVEILDLTDTAISDDGVAWLDEKLPRTAVNRR